MATFTGFSTQHAGEPRPPRVKPGIDGGASQLNGAAGVGKKFTMTDEQLVVQDFINALNIPLGQKPGQPSFGTTLWSFIFEPNVADIQVQIQNEIRRVAQLDPRLILNTVQAYPQDNGILLEIEIAVAPFNEARNLTLYFDQQANKAFGV
jgi:phage baseplate assembly protein W